MVGMRISIEKVNEYLKKKFFSNKPFLLNFELETAIVSGI